MATMSILGLYNYDPTIFDGMRLPEGLNKDTLVNNLLIELAELEVIYPSAPMMKTAIEMWSSKRLWNWEELYKTTQYDYDPLLNFDVTTEMTEEGTRDSSANGSSSGAQTGETTDKVSGYDGSSLVDNQNSKTSASSSTTSSSSATDTNIVKRSTRNYGDNSVRSTQYMIEEQRKVVKFNLFDVIIKEFADRFCIGIW